MRMDFSTVRHRCATGQYSLKGLSVFMGRKNVFLTIQLGQESCMGFGRATGVSRGSYSKCHFFTAV
jgi:hypothetical protein